MLSYKYGGAKVAVKNCLSHFSMLVPAKANVKLANKNTENDRGIGIILYRFTKFPIIYPVRPFYYCPGHLPTPSHQVPSNFMLDFKRLRLNHQTLWLCWPSRLLLEITPPDSKRSWLSSNRNLSKSTLTETRILLYHLSVCYQNKISLRLFISLLVTSLLSG